MRRGGAFVASFAIAAAAVGSSATWTTEASAAGSRRASGSDAATAKLVRANAGATAAESAREHARAGDCKGALDFFDAALRTTVDPALHRDRGFCHEKLGDDFPAIDDYRFYLTNAPEAVDAEAVRDRLNALEANHGGDNLAAAQSATNHAGSTSYGEGVTISANSGIDTSGSAVDQGPTHKAGTALIPVGYRGEDEPRLARNSVFIELMGSSLIDSINFDHIFGEHFSLRAGIGGFSASSAGLGSVSSAWSLFIPVMANALIGPGNHKAEIGGGVLLMPMGGTNAGGGPFSFGFAHETGGTTFDAFGQVYVGYRYTPRDGGFNFRVGIPIFFQPGQLSPWAPGVSFGYGF